MNPRQSKRLGRQRTSLPKRIGSEEASKIIKRHAAKQRVRIKLSEAQMQAILAQWKVDPRRPFELGFFVEGRKAAELKVASCAYANDTCCA